MVGMTKFIRYATHAAFCFGVSVLITSGAALSQEAELPVRVPETGLSILDCAPPAPAPENSCIVRVPSNKTLADISSRSLTDESADFRIVRDDRSLPEGLTISSTLILIDLSKGPNNGRVGQWPVERAQIQRIIEALPADGEIAVFGFGADLQRQSNFSDSRADALEAVGKMELTQNNTILSSNITAAIDLLSERRDAMLKNLVVITDGDEEGVGDTDAINKAAGEAGVTLSAVGMFWRGESNAATSRGIDVLNRITAPQNGLMQPVFLRNRTTIADNVDAFTNLYLNSIARSGVIVPRGEGAAEAEITVIMDVPVPGTSNETQQEKFTVKYTPASAEINKDPSVDEPPELPEGKIFGYDSLYVYLAAAVAALLLLILLIVLTRRRGPDEIQGGGDDEVLGEQTNADSTATDFEEGVEIVPPPHPATPVKPVSAYLVRVDTGERLAIRGNRIALGRSSSNGVTIPDHGISRVHAELHRNGNGGFSLTDLDSLNGTFVNEKKVTGTVVVRIGDVLGFGKVRAKIVLP